MRCDRFLPYAAAAIALTAHAPLSAAPVVVTPPAPVVELLDPGAEPRAPLRIEPAQGTTQAVVFALDTAMAQELDGEPFIDVDLPTIHQLMTASVETVDLDGAYTVRSIIEDVWLEDPEPGEDPLVRASMEEAIDSATGLHVVVHSDARGVAHSLTIEADDRRDDPTSQEIQELSRQIQQIMPPLPIEAVGVGARWRVTTRGVINGVPMKAVSTFALTERRGSVVTLESTAEIGLPGDGPEPLDVADAGEIATTVESLEGAGAGRIVFDLTRPMPVSADASSTVVSELSIDIPGGEHVTSRIKMELRIAITPAEDPPSEPGRPRPR
ncbi:MAG: hypothetical protein D6693_02830 [Planctomycetota bacterium]|nr:MAG: hypothetical protein D6693_02830 [Planctomycetota bacterium]